MITVIEELSHELSFAVVIRIFLLSTLTGCPDEKHDATSADIVQCLHFHQV